MLKLPRVQIALFFGAYMKLSNIFLRVSLLALLLAALPLTAEASNKVSSPDVTRGQAELEYRGGYDMDDTARKDGQQTHKLVGNYGITDRWRMEAKAILAGPGGNLDWTYIEWSNRYQVWKEKEGFVKLSLQENYKFSLQDGHPDKLELTALASKDIGQFTHIANLNFENELGSSAHGGTDFNLGWKTKYRYGPHFEPGAEFYADFGKFGSPQSVSPDKYQIGPVVSGKIADGFKYDVGYLFGLNRAVPDGRIKWILTAAF
jgi:hypothetical protein